MTSNTLPLLQRPAWAALQAHYQRIAPLHLRKLFANDPANSGDVFVAKLAP